MHLGLRGECKDEGMRVGESEVGRDGRTVTIVRSPERGHTSEGGVWREGFRRCVNLDAQNDERGWLRAKVNLSLKRSCAWGGTPRQDLPRLTFIMGSPCEVTFHRAPVSSPTPMGNNWCLSPPLWKS